jgi:hypothetical protein
VRTIKIIRPLVQLSRVGKGVKFRADCNALLNVSSADRYRELITTTPQGPG